MISSRLPPFFLLFLAGFWLPVAGQNLNQQEAELDAIKARIQQSEQQLSQTRDREEEIIETLDQFDQQIALRQNLVNRYRGRIETISVERDTLSASIDQMQAEIDKMQQEYRARVVHTYKFGRMHELALILSARSINEMLIRALYLRSFARKRRSQLGDIQAKAEALAERKTRLDALLDRNRVLLEDAEKERGKVEALKNERESLIGRIRVERRDLEQKLRQQQQNAAQLRSRIASLIAENARSREEAASVDPDVKTRDAALSTSFSGSRGSLDWPISGRIVGAYGTRIHPVWKTQTTSHGIEIEAASGGVVKLVFNGTVSKIFVMPGYGTCVAVNHGDFTTVYGNLSAVSVNAGQTVTKGTQIGRSGTSGEPLGTRTFFAVFQGERSTNPTQWLK